jgi:hypothetical protein
MRTWVHENTEKVFLEKPEFFTIRAMWNKGPCDFVLCRKEGAYSDFRHPEKVEIGTILDDLARRDFTVNAIAKDMGTGQIIDPFDGRSDIEKKIIRCVGGTDRLFEDPLRMLRAIRFSITKGFDVEDEIFSIWSGQLSDDAVWQGGVHDNLRTPELVEKFKASVSSERTREELLRCFEFSTVKTLQILSFADQSWMDAIFGNDLWLRPTLEA